jgi:hypothetical protein
VGAGHADLGASQAGRDDAIEALKAAYVAGRLTEDEFEARVGQALAARTHADLAALTADIPAGPVAAPPAGIPDGVVAGSSAAIIAAAALGGALLIGGSALILWAITMTGALLFTVSVLLYARQERRSRGRRPPRSALAGPSGPSGPSGPAPGGALRPAPDGLTRDGKSSGHDYYALRSYLPRSRTVVWHRVVMLTGCAGPTTRPC